MLKNALSFFCQSVLQTLEIVQYRLQEVPLTPEGGSKLKDSQVISVRCETSLDCQHQSKISGSNLGRNTFFNLEQHSEPGQIKIS